MADDFQNLKEVPDPAPGLTLFPWLRELARRAALEWADNPAGKARIDATLQELPDFQRQIGQLYFQQGLTPPQIRSRLERTLKKPVSLIDVLEQLEEVLQRLTSNRLWRLLSLLARYRDPSRIRETAESAPSTDASPAVAAPRNDEFDRLWQAWNALDSRTALILELRYDDCQSIPQIGLITGLTEDQTRGSLRSGLTRLRRSLAPGASKSPE